MLKVSAETIAIGQAALDKHVSGVTLSSGCADPLEAARQRVRLLEAARATCWAQCGQCSGRGRVARGTEEP